MKGGLKNFLRCKKGDANTSPGIVLLSLRWHYPYQVKGSKLITSSQPAATGSPDDLTATRIPHSSLTVKSDKKISPCAGYYSALRLHSSKKCSVIYASFSLYTRKERFPARFAW